MSVIDIAIAGALGRMGKAIATAAQADPALRVAARFDRTSSEGLVDAAQAMKAAQVVIDFTAAASSADLAEQAAEAGVAMIIGSTGFDDAQLARIGEAGRRVPIVRAGNFSLGVNMLMGLVAQASRALPADTYDIEVFEAHHRRKVDAPSGTALMLGEAAATGRGQNLADVAAHGRTGFTGARESGEIGFSVARGGGIVGEHSVIFAAEDEILTLSHSARDRSLFARGALAAAKWVVGKPPGSYDMQDVLGFRGEVY